MWTLDQVIKILTVHRTHATELNVNWEIFIIDQSNGMKYMSYYMYLKEKHVKSKMYLRHTNSAIE